MRALLFALALSSCTMQVSTKEIEDMTDHNAPRNPVTGALEGWGKGGIINPPVTNVPDPDGESSLTLQCRLDHAAVFTIQFTTSAPQVASRTANIPVAIIDFSVNGITTRRKVSMYDGVSISGPGQVVKVKAFDESQDPSHSAPYSASITVTPGTRGGTVVPTLQNISEETITAGGTHIFDIEQNVGAVLVRFDIGPHTTTGTVDFDKYVIQFLDGSSSAIATVQNPTDFVHIPPGAVAIVFQNNDAISADVKPVFGIDG